MARIRLFDVACVLAYISAPRSIHAFTIYPPIDSTAFASALNITTDCLATLNTTLPDCDQTLLSMIGAGLDNFWWEDDNVTALCNDNCTSQTDFWDFNVAVACEDQTLSVGGKLVPVDSLTGRYKDGLGIACLSNLDQDGWCLTESQDWTGSDIVRPDCAVTPSDPQCVNTTNIQPGNDRLANLYSDDVLCSSCFVQILSARVSSPFLPDTDYSEYLVDQLQDVADVCSTSIGDITTRPLFGYNPAPAPTSQVLGDGTTSTTVATSVATCVGQTINAPKVKRDEPPALRYRRPDVKEEKRQSSQCDSLSVQYSVTTGDLQALTDSTTCTLSGGVCAPAACTLKQVTAAASCDTLAASASVTTQQFLLWNPNIIGLCDSVQINQYICVGAPGGTYSLAPPPLGTDADAGNQQRGGVGGVVTPTSTVTGTANPVSEAQGPTATQAGIVSQCNNYGQAQSGDNCVDFAKAHSITPDQLYTWNPALGAGGANCSLNFWALEYYCIGIAGSATAPTTTTTKSSSVSIPSPTQSGIISGCSKYAQAKSGDDCFDFATAQGITPSQLYSYNTILGANGANCGTNFQAGEWYCVGVAGVTSSPSKTSTATPTGPVAAPGPTQSGIISTCNAYLAANSGATCSTFASRAGISTTQLYAWNEVLGANGANCAGSLWADEYYCVGVAVPSPIQSGTAINCVKYLTADDGATCPAFASRAGITAAQLYQWNPVLGSGGANCASSLWAGEYYCVGVSA